jgi:cell division septal protein FtsQ
MRRVRKRVRNQRVSNRRQRRQQHLLDVKVRSRSATQQRNRRVLVFVSKLVLVLLIAVGICLGVREGARRFLFENPDYQVTNIEVQTDGVLQRDQILKTADLREGENIFTINLSRVHDRLQDLPQIDDVQVVRKLPSEIDIQIVERKPVAWITDEREIVDPFATAGVFLVDGRGVLMKEKKLLPEYLGLPLILGCLGESLEAGKIIESPEAKAALELLRLSTRSFMQTRFQIREIDLSKGYCLMVTDKDRTRVTFGFDDLDMQLQRLQEFLVYSDDTKQELGTVNLLVKRNIPVTFGKSPVDVINDTVEPAATPRILKAVPVSDVPEFGTFSARRPPVERSSKPRSVSPATTKPSSGEATIRRAIPVHQNKKEKGNGQ